ncbi:hypothetical protein [Paludibaculum fermentans]|uniref:Uncharacterized protein n=1 Tax=Paludibaculum fermentans TaxID=1473598 RepID=A0A7S7NP14_PALFE|nr:hypothetical protein [Paludibaculum fermentans]QOY87163.1 hypothetical protein IRI77_31030 [Paludibaculum fermentans]
MRNATVLICLLAAYAMGQARRPAFVGAPGGSGVRGGGPPRVAPRVYRPGSHFWRPYGGGWGTGYDAPHEAAPSPVEPVRERPALIVNRDFVQEKPMPQSTVFPDGALPPPKRGLDATPVQARCTVRFKDGETVEATACSVREDTLSFLTAKGRMTRVTLDLVDKY